MKHLMSLLLFEFHNVHMMHWKIKGKNFQKDHEYMAEVYDQMLEDVDTVTEIAMQYGIQPISYKEMITIMSHDSTAKIIDPEEDYSSEECFTKLIDIFNRIIDDIARVKEDDELNLTDFHKSDLDSIQSWYSLRMRYLIPRRMM